MSDTDPNVSLLAAFRGTVACRRTANALTLSGAAADSADDGLILTFISSSLPDIPDSLTAVSVCAIDELHYRITSASRDMVLEATSLHAHRDIGRVFYRAIPPRPAPLNRRLLWGVILWLAGSSAGKRLLSTLR